jgi:glycosyltransferase involved in cell wall biosynthesis
MKIAIFTVTFPPYFGGMGNVAYLHAKGLSQLGHHVTVYTPSQFGDAITIKNEDDIVVNYFRPFLQYRLAAILPPSLFDPSAFQKILLHFPSVGISESILIKSLFSDIKFSLYYHMDLIGNGWFWKSFFTIYSKNVVNRTVKVARRIAVSSFDYLATSRLSQLFKENRDKFVEIPCPVDTTIFTKLGKNTREFDRSKTILFVGALDKAHYFKGLKCLILAVGLLNKKIPAKLKVIGAGALKHKYEKFANSHLKTGEVEFLGSTDTATLVIEYNNADCVVLPSLDRSEAFGLVLIEAMACATPVIASRLSGVRSIIDEGVNGLLFQTGNVMDLQHKLVRILATDKDNWGKHAYEKVRRKYSLNLISKKIEQMLLSYD